MIKRRESIVILILLGHIVLFLLFTTTLPHRIDKLLLLNDDLCCVDVKDYMREEKWLRLIRNGHVTALINHFVEAILWKLIVRHWDRDHDAIITKRQHNECKFHADSSRLLQPGPCNLHPICQRYRELRSTILTEEICIPWIWYYSGRLQLRNVSIRSPSTHLLSDLIPQLYHTWEFSSGMSCINLKFTNTNPDKSETQLPPSVVVKSLAVNFKSWTKPVVSMNADDIELNVIIQKGRLPTPFSRHRKDDDKHFMIEDNSGLLLKIGDMTIQDAIRMIPKPPEKEGIYPMIGLVRVANFSINVVEHQSKNGKQSMHSLAKMNLPDEFFHPVTNLTNTHLPHGIDRFHFHSLLESEVLSALRRHLFDEAEKALHNSLHAATEFKDLLQVQNHKIQDQFHKLVKKTQQLYVDRWFELGAKALQQTLWNGWIDKTAPISKAFNDWTRDIKNILSEPSESPLKVVMMHHWDQIAKFIQEQDAKGLNWGFKELRLNFGEMQSALNNLATQSKDGLDGLVASCKAEVREMWLSWHLQFMPVLD